MYKVLNAILSNSYTVALAVPLILLICGALAKKLARGSAWEQRDFFLGIEATLVALSSNLLYLFELAKAATTPPTPVLSPSPGSVPGPSPTPALNLSAVTPDGSVLAVKLTIAAVFLVVTFAALLWVMSTHQDWDKTISAASGVSKWSQFWRLCLLGNLIGLGLMCAFILLVKGVE